MVVCVCGGFLNLGYLLFFFILQVPPGQQPSAERLTRLQNKAEWQNEVLHTAATPKRSMLPEHIFALAQVLGRPIICVGPREFAMGAGAYPVFLNAHTAHIPARTHARTHKYGLCSYSFFFSYLSCLALCAHCSKLRLEQSSSVQCVACLLSGSC